MNQHFLSTKLSLQFSGCQAELVEADLNKKFFFVASRQFIPQLYWRRTHVPSVLLLIFSCMVCIFNHAHAQLGVPKEKFTHADTLRGSNNENRNWWNVLRYDITVKPDYEKKEIVGKTVITYHEKIGPNKSDKKGKNISKKYLEALVKKDTLRMQLDLQQPLIIDSITVVDSIRVAVYDYYTTKSPFKGTETTKLSFKTNKNIVSIIIPTGHFLSFKNNIDSITIYYHGKPKEAKTPPWDGGWIWKKDKNGNPWMSVAVQGLGASAWFPCKDYQGDEPDNGASLTMIVPDTLIAIANGRKINQSTITSNGKRETMYSWEVKNPINNYNIVPYIGKYVNFTDTLIGEKGKLDLSYWVLDYNLDKAKEHFKQVKPMLRSMEYWFGPYPFYEDGYKLVDAPHLGMEHQSAIAYGNQYKNGYLGTDRSGNTGWGLKWDFIIIHESGHEWFANNITTNDIADMWVHEAFTTYSETLFTEYYYGIQAGNEYNYGQRKNIRNDIPIIGPYGVNKEGSSDEYDKGSNMIHSIRHAINDDKKFREILRGLNKKFYHQTVTTKQIEDYINTKAGFNFQKVFDQYLRTIQIPTLEYFFNEQGNELSYRYTTCKEGFNLPLVFKNNNQQLKILPTENWKTVKIKKEEQGFVLPENLDKIFYIKVKKVEAAN